MKLSAICVGYVPLLLMPPLLLVVACGPSTDPGVSEIGTVRSAVLHVQDRKDFIYFGPVEVFSGTVAQPFSSDTFPPRWNIWPSSASGRDWHEVITQSYCNQFDNFIPGDYNGDHKQDIACYRTSDNTWNVLFNTGTATQPAFAGSSAFAVFGEPGARLVPADYNGDFRTDCAYYRPADGTWHIRTSNAVGSICDGSETITQFGDWYDVNAPADYDGDGKADRAVFRPSNNTWYVSRSGGGSDLAVVWGNSGDRPVPGGDFNADGYTDYAYFHEADGTWHVHLNPLGNPGPDTSVQFGASTDRLVPGDYTGDGKTDYAVFRPSTLQWFVKRSDGLPDMVRPDPSLTGGFGTAATNPGPPPSNPTGNPKVMTSMMPYAIMEPRISTFPADRTRTLQQCLALLWPNGVIPYEIVDNPSDPDSNHRVFTDVMKSTIVAAATNWNIATSGAINFQRIVGSPKPVSRLQIQPSSTQHNCSLGYPEPDPITHEGVDVCSLDQEPGAFQSVEHELGHAIGLNHEHIRVDRDRFVIIDDQGFNDYNYQGNWYKCGVDDFGSGFGPFDYGSQMDYHSNPPYFIWYQDGSRHTFEPGMQVTLPAQNSSRPTREGSAVLEEYAYRYGWRKFKSLGRDLDSQRPLSKELAAGVTVLGTPAITSQGAPGGLDLFARGSNGQLYHLYSAQGTWALSYDQPTGTQTWDSDPAAASLGPGSVIVAEANAKNVSVIEELGFAWHSSWVSLGGPTGNGTACSSPAVAASRGGTARVYVRGCDGRIYSRTRTGSDVWSAWTLYAAPPAGVTFVGRPAVAATSGGDEVFSNSSNGHLWDFSSGWIDRASGLSASASPSAAAGAAGRLEVVFTDATGVLSWIARDRGVGGTSNWAPARAIGGAPISDTTLVSGTPDHLDMVAMLTDATPWHRTFDRPKRFLSQDFRWDRRAEFVYFGASDLAWHVATLRHVQGIPALDQVIPHTPTAADVFGDPSIDRFVPGDYDGDGQTDYAVLRNTGVWWVRYSSTGSDVRYPAAGTFGGQTDIPVPGDYTGDGRADYAYWRPSDGTWHIVESGGNGNPTVIQFGGLGDAPVPGDYDGDGKTDVAVWRESNTTWFARPSSGGTDLFWSSVCPAGSRPVPGDYDGDGRTDAACFTLTNDWKIRRSSDGVGTTQQFGTRTDRLVPADYDWDGKTDIAVFRGSEGKWYVHPSAGGDDLVVPFGTNADYTPYSK